MQDGLNGWRFKRFNSQQMSLFIKHSLTPNTCELESNHKRTKIDTQATTHTASLSPTQTSPCLQGNGKARLRCGIMSCLLCTWYLPYLMMMFKTYVVDQEIITPVYRGSLDPECKRKKDRKNSIKENCQILRCLLTAYKDWVKSVFMGCLFPQ